MGNVYASWLSTNFCPDLSNYLDLQVKIPKPGSLTVILPFLSSDNKNPKDHLFSDVNFIIPLYNVVTNKIKYTIVVFRCNNKD